MLAQHYCNHVVLGRRQREKEIFAEAVHPTYQLAQKRRHIHCTSISGDEIKHPINVFLETIYIAQLGTLEKGPEQLSRVFPAQAVLGENAKSKEFQCSFGSNGLLVIVFKLECEHGAEVVCVYGVQGLSGRCSKRESSPMLRKLLCIKAIETTSREGIKLRKLEVFSPGVEYPWKPVWIFLWGQTAVSNRLDTQMPSKEELTEPQYCRNQQSSRKKHLHIDFDTLSLGVRK